MKCTICNKEISRANQLKIHINRYHNVDAMTNEKNYIKSQIEIEDAEFDKVQEMYLSGFTVYDIKSRYGVSFASYIYLLGIKRSASEAKKTTVYQNRVEATNVERYGVSNPSQRKDVKEKKKATFIRNRGYENNFCNPEIQRIAQERIDYDKVAKSNLETMIIRYGVHNRAQIPEVRKRNSSLQKKRYSCMSDDERRKITEKARSNVKYISSQELRIQSILNFLNVEYTANGFLYSYNWDLIFRNRVIIEVQGDFWHANPSAYKENDILLDALLAKDVWDKDARKRAKAEENGYKVFYLWESELNSMNDEEIANRIKEIIC